MPTIRDIVEPFTELSEKQRLRVVLKRRQARRDSEDEQKAKRKKTERKGVNKRSSNDIDNLFDGLSPEQAQSILDSINE